MRQSVRVWSLVAAALVLSLQTPLLAAARVTISELKTHSALYYDQPITLECYYDKESPIWVSALPDADQWIGFFVTGPPERSLTWHGEYYNLLFAPEALRDALRTLRTGDKITVIGQGFHYHSTSFDGVGIRAQQLLRNWGVAAAPIGQGLVSLDPFTVHSNAQDDVRHAMRVTAEAAASSTGKYTAVINGKRYEGLRYGDRYNFDGVDFSVDQAP